VSVELLAFNAARAMHLRSLERLRTDDILVRAQWQDRWKTL
jgi:hypothetical protein